MAQEEPWSEPNDGLVQAEAQPKRIHLNISNLEVISEDGHGMGTVVKIDGREFNGIRSLSLHVTAESVWTVEMDYFPMFQKDDTAPDHTVGE